MGSIGEGHIQSGDNSVRLTYYHFVHLLVFSRNILVWEYSIADEQNIANLWNWSWENFAFKFIRKDNCLSMIKKFGRIKMDFFKEYLYYIHVS